MNRKTSTGSSHLLVSFLLRVGIASVFFYAALASFLEPDSWVGFLPQWIKVIFPARLLLFGFSFFEIGLALWLISGKKAFFSSIVAVLTLFAIIITNIGALDIVFRDVAILFAALSLAVLSYKS